PDTDVTGLRTFTWTVSNGTFSSNTAAVNLTILSDLASTSKTTTVNANLIFGQTDVHYTGVDPLASVTIVTLPAHGKLQVTSISTASFLTAGTVIAVGNIGSLIYIPDTDYIGSDSFTWSAYDGTISS